MIQMIGIDHTTASVDVRSVFSVKKSEMKDEMEWLRKRLHLDGVVLLNTCNRMELWVSGQDEEMDLLAALCEYKKLSKSQYEKYFLFRKEDAAIEHLMLLASGLVSAIMGEDQILSQVKKSIDFSRQERLSDGTLDVLFRMAVTVAKKIKSEITFHRANATAVEEVLALLKQQETRIENMKCLVIGNGEYGRLVANRLVEQKADVTVTIRQYHSGEVFIPKGCKTILYGDRYSVLKDCELVISATASPNYTITCERVKECMDGRARTIVDLAVPRDVEPEVADIEGITLYDIDRFQRNLPPGNEDALQKARDLIQQKMKEFHLWYDYQDMVPLIQSLRESTVTDFNLRIHKTVNKLELSQDMQQELCAHMDDAVGKVTANLFYRMRDVLDQEEFKKCMKALWEYENE